MNENHSSTSNFTASWINLHDDRWLDCESELIANGFPLPFWHRLIGVRCEDVGDCRLLVIRDSKGAACLGVAVYESKSRALPGHRILRIRRLGTIGGEALSAGMAELFEYVRSTSRALRLEIGVFSRESDKHAKLAHELMSFGCHENTRPRLYRQTILLDLRPNEADIFASFHKQTRKNIRRMEKEPFSLHIIQDTKFSPRLDQLLAETMSRTGGVHNHEDWSTRISVSRERPDLSRLIGLFEDPGREPESLVAFAWACNHGDHVEYCTTASTRITGSRVSLTYPLVWDLIRWAKDIGAEWLDFGGITSGSLHSEDPRGGISDFKRSFSNNVVSVGSEWLFEPHRVRSHVASIVSSTRNKLNGFLK